MSLPITAANTPPIIAAEAVSIATGIIKSMLRDAVDEACIKKFVLKVNQRPIKNPALSPVLNVLICAQRLKINANVKA